MIPIQRNLKFFTNFAILLFLHAIMGEEKEKRVEEIEIRIIGSIGRRDSKAGCIRSGTD